MSILTNIVGNVDTEKAERLKRAEGDFFYYAQTYLGAYFSSPPAEYQKILIDIINQEALELKHITKLFPFIANRYITTLKPVRNLEGIIDVEPRGFSKSTRMSLAYPLWRILFRKSMFPIIFSASQDMSNLILENIKAEITGNDLILSDFGDLKGEKWKSDFITLKNGTAVVAKGAGASTRGIRYRETRPDLIICDDVLNDEAAQSKTQREKIYRWFKRVVLPLGKNVFVVLVNTIFHNDDLICRLLNEINDGKLKGWAGLRFSAITPGGESLWPEYWPLNLLLKKKQAMGSLAFSTEMMNEPLSDEDRLFKEDWIEYFQDIQFNSLKILMGVDPALGTGDYSAIVTIGVDSHGTVYTLDAYADRVTPDAFMEKVIEKHLIYKPILIAFEEVLFQQVMKQYLLQKAAEKGVYLPVRGVKPGRLSKETRIAKLSPLVENGLIKFKQNQKLLLEQLLSFPKGDHDDLCDALYYAVELISGGSAAPIVLPLGIHRESARVLRTYH